VVSHDREFLDNVVTSIVVFEDDRSIQEYVGGYSDWLRHGHGLAVTDSPFEVEERRRQDVIRKQRKKSNKLSYKDQRELDQLPAEIEAIEATVADLQKTVSAPEFYSQEQTSVQSTLQQLAETQALLENCVERWSELEILQASLRPPSE